MNKKQRREMVVWYDLRIHPFCHIKTRVVGIFLISLILHGGGRRKRRPLPLSSRDSGSLTRGNGVPSEFSENKEFHTLEPLFLHPKDLSPTRTPNPNLSSPCVGLWPLPPFLNVLTLPCLYLPRTFIVPRWRTRERTGDPPRPWDPCGETLRRST